MNVNSAAGWQLAHMKWPMRADRLSPHLELGCEVQAEQVERVVGIRDVLKVRWKGRGKLLGRDRKNKRHKVPISIFKPARSCSLGSRDQLERNPIPQTVGKAIRCLEQQTLYCLLKKLVGYDLLCRRSYIEVGPRVRQWCGSGLWLRLDGWTGVEP